MLMRRVDAIRALLPIAVPLFSRGSLPVIVLLVVVVVVVVLAVLSLTLSFTFSFTFSF